LKKKVLPNPSVSSTFTLMLENKYLSGFFFFFKYRLMGILQTKWNDYGYHSGIYSFNRSQDNLKVEGICGGHCGYCRTKHHKIWSKLNTNDGEFLSIIFSRVSV